jgi:hypothetical protein
MGQPLEGVISQDSGVSEVASESRRRELKHLSTSSENKTRQRFPEYRRAKREQPKPEGASFQGLRDSDVRQSHVIERSGKACQSG